MTTADSPALPPALPEPTQVPLWSVSLLPRASGSLATDPFGGCVVTTPTTLVAYGHDGRRRWDSPVGGRTTEPPVSAPDGTLLRAEGGLIVARHPSTGTVMGHFAAPASRDLISTPWGDLLYTQHRPHHSPVVHCVSRSGRHRWSRRLEARSPAPRPFALAGLIVIPWGGALWGLDQTGVTRWIAGPAGIHPPDQPGIAALHRGRAVVQLTVHHLDPVRALVSLRSQDGPSMFLLDAATPQVVPVTADSPLRAPFAAVAAPPTGTVQTLVAAGADWVVLAAESRGVARIECLADDGNLHWHWQAPGPLTHQPVAGHGIVYAGSAGALWALAVRPAASRPG